MEPLNAQGVALRAACEKLAGDHRRLPMMLSEAEWRVQQKLFPGAERCFAEFCFGLERHLAEEDGAVSQTGESGTPAKPQAADRETLRRMLLAAEQAIYARDCDWFASSAGDLYDALAAHADAHERKLFPMFVQTRPGPAARV